MRKHLFVLVGAVALILPNVCAAQIDKVMHATAGFGITVTVASVTHRPKLGLMAGVGAGVAKEIWDAHHVGHTASARDAIATAAASAAGYALFRYVFMKKPPVKIATVDSNPPPTSVAPPRVSGAPIPAARTDAPVAATVTETPSTNHGVAPGGGN